MIKQMIPIGIMSHVEYKDRTIAIAKGEYRPQPGEPKIWFDSLETMTKVLNSKNQHLLQIILEQEPDSIAVLEHLTGRSRSNLSATLHVMERYGIVELKKQKRALKPIVKATDFRVEFGLYHSQQFVMKR